MSYNPGKLDAQSIYFWKIVSRDNHGNETHGPLWNFTTKTEQCFTQDDLNQIIINIGLLMKKQEYQVIHQHSS